MRISDWRSDVCASDLQRGPCRCADPARVVGDEIRRHRCEHAGRDAPDAGDDEETADDEALRNARSGEQGTAATAEEEPCPVQMPQIRLSSRQGERGYAVHLTAARTAHSKQQSKTA